MKTKYLLRSFAVRFAVLTVTGFAVTAGGMKTVLAEEGNLLLNQWVRQSDDAAVAGRFVEPVVGGIVESVPDATIALIDADNRRRAVTTDAEGAFRFENVSPGQYTLVARGEEHRFAVLALNVASARQAGANRLPAAIELTAGRVDKASINLMLIRYLPPQPAGRAAAPVESYDLNAIADSLRSRNVHTVSRIDGGMYGTVYQPGMVNGRLVRSEPTNVFLFSDGEVIRRVVTDSQGSFFIDDLEPGVYTVFIAGASGFATIGFELVDGTAASRVSNDDGETLTSMQPPGPAPQLGIQVAPAGAAPIVTGAPADEVVFVEEEPGFITPMGGGGFGGGGFGGGGGGGGIGGGGGGLLIAGGIAAAIVAAATSGRNRPVTPPPATPAAPGPPFTPPGPPFTPPGPPPSAPPF